MVQPIVPQTMHSSYPRGMCLFTSARTVVIVFARSAGSKAMYCAGVLTVDGGFMIRRLPDEVYHRSFETSWPAGVREYRMARRHSIYWRTGENGRESQRFSCIFSGLCLDAQCALFPH